MEAPHAGVAISRAVPVDLDAPYRGAGWSEDGMQ